MSRTGLLYSGHQEDGVSMKDEMHDILEPYSRWGLFRRVRRLDGGQPLMCPQCRKVGSQNHSLVHVCDKCLGVGYIWDEEWIRFYQWPGVGAARSGRGYKEYLGWGALPTNFAVVYVEAHVNPTEEDKVIQVAFDDYGNPLEPLQRTLMFDIRAVDDYRLDSGRLEYYRLSTMKQTIGYYGQPLETQEPGPRRLP